MNQPMPPGYGQYPPQGYPQQGYPPQQYPQQPQQGYAQPYSPPAGTGGYDFAQLYGQADLTGGRLLDKADYDSVVEIAEFGRTKDGTKGQWTVKFRVTTGPFTGSPLTTTIAISPKTNDGRDNPFGLGRMFNDLAALGIPVPDPANPSVCLNGQAPFWVMGWTEQQVAQAMTGKPAVIAVYQDDYNGEPRNKIGKIKPPHPGAPTTWKQPQQAQQYPPQPGYGQPMPGVAGNGPPPGAPPQGQPAAPPAWQSVTQQAAPAGQPPIAGAPPWAQPGVPGQGGVNEFTQAGMSQQPQNPQQPPPPPAQPPWAGQAPQGQPAQTPPAPAQPPWAGQQAPPAGQNGYPQGQPAQQQPGQPELPPWAQ